MKRMLFFLFTAWVLNLAMVAQDSTRITEWEEDQVEVNESTPDNHRNTKKHFLRSRIFGENEVMGPAVVIVALTFGFPLVIIFIAFYFQYRNKKARYRLAEKALEAGQPIPQEFIRMKDEKDILSKGIKNICTGLGLFIFLWAVVDLRIGTIGLLVMFTGVGQVIIHYVNSGNKDK